MKILAGNLDSLRERYNIRFLVNSIKSLTIHDLNNQIDKKWSWPYFSWKNKLFQSSSSKDAKPADVKTLRSSNKDLHLVQQIGISVKTMCGLSSEQRKNFGCHKIPKTWSFLFRKS